MQTNGTAWPTTILVVHPKERRSKCSVNPLRGRSGFAFWKHPQRGPESLNGYVRLGFGGPVISEKDCDSGLLILDGTWRWAESMEADFAEVPVRSLPALETAYPRVSKTYDDPLGGLATIEALFASYHLLGRPTAGLLDEYHWADEFLERNREFFLTQRHGVAEKEVSMCVCGESRSVYEGTAISDLPELARALREIETNSMTWETLFECVKCGQKWLEKYTSHGHSDVPETRKVS